MEASGKSLVEAREAALDLLGVAEDDAEFLTLSEPKAGLFGRVRGEARVQARVRPVAPPSKRGRRKRPARKEGGDLSVSNDEVSSGDPNASEMSRTLVKPTGSGGKRTKGRGTGAGAGAGGENPSDQTDASTGQNGNGRRKVARGASLNEDDVRRPVDDRKMGGRSDGKAVGKEVIVEESLTITQQGEAGKAFVTGLIREFGLEANVLFNEIDEETVEVAAVGDDLGLLVGPRGATLMAVQDLTRTFVQRQSENRTDRILVDVGGYRQKRSAALRRFAEEIVSQVRDSGVEQALEPMSPADRKVIHDTVNSLDGVRTRSEGEDSGRYVVIEPVT